MVTFLLISHRNSSRQVSEHANWWVGPKRRFLGGVLEKMRRTKMRRAEPGFRVFATVFCLVSLWVMATDTISTWSSDFFCHYNDYRYTLVASVVAFTYSGSRLSAGCRGAPPCHSEAHNSGSLSQLLQSRHGSGQDEQTPLLNVFVVLSISWYSGGRYPC